MRLLPLLALFALPFSVSASLDADRAQLVRLAAANNGVINLNEHTFDLLTNPKRDWSASIQFTALDKKRRCTPCKEFDPSFNAVAKAWSKVSAADRDSHFFATIDFETGMPVFQRLGMQSAPVVQVYPAAEGLRRPANGKTAAILLDFSQGFEAGPLAEQLSHYTPVPIPYKAPVDVTRIITGAFVLLAAIAAIRFLAPVLRNRWTWAVVVVLTSLVMTSGFMFVRIRNMPHTGHNGQWIAGGFQNQFGQEIQVISMVYGCLSMAFLMLTLVVPTQKSASRQRAQVYLWTAIIVIMYSLLISIFKEKNRGYPFRLLF